MFIHVSTAGGKDANVSTYPVCACIQNILFQENMENRAVVEVATFLQEIVVVQQITRLPNGLLCDC